MFYIRHIDYHGEVENLWEKIATIMNIPFSQSLHMMPNIPNKLCCCIFKIADKHVHMNDIYGNQIRIQEKVIKTKKNLDLRLTSAYGMVWNAWGWSIRHAEKESYQKLV